MPVSEIHESRAAVLETISHIAGYTEGLGVLPDGTRPDVIAVSPLTGSVFIGDAKEAEGPGDEIARKRLRRYMSWFVSNLAARGSGSQFALCVGKDVAEEWSIVLEDLAREAGLKRWEPCGDRLDAETSILWVRG